MPTEQINGIDLYYESHGDGPAVTFLHGAGGNHISWWQQIPTFSQRYRCIVIDHRNFGRSTDPTNEGDSRFVDDLAALLERFGIERTALVAQSMGGRTALGYAVRHPERVAALAMCDTWGFFDWPELRERAAQLRDTDDQRPLENRALGPKYQDEHPRGTFLYQQIAALNPPRNINLNEGGPTRDEVATLRVPTLFLVGSEDAIVRPEVMRMMHELVPGSEYLEFPGCGHSVYFENSPAFNEAVGDFLAKRI